MKPIKSGLALLATAVLVTGCATYDLDGVAGMSPQGDAFQKGLHSEYVKLAKMEAMEDDWSDAGRFNDKARVAAMGTKFGPQMMSKRSIPADKVDEMAGFRDRLVKALEKGAMAKPAAAARAQAGFDCWMQEQEENFQPEDIAACKKSFVMALAEIESKPKPKKKKIPGPFVVHFDMNSAELNDDTFSIVAEAADKAKWAKATGIIVGAHTDTSGSAAYNQALSEARMKAVTEIITMAGWDGKLTVKAYGEELPAVPTADETPEMKNRRVEIVLVQ
ncbi:MAG: OmpA family protein [Rhodospirillales bacterium]|nr:OmpA family protein [Rhodospirillales bacterium]